MSSSISSMLTWLYLAAPFFLLLWFVWRQSDPNFRAQLSPFRRLNALRYHAVRNGLQTLRNAITAEGDLHPGGPDLSAIKAEVNDLLSLLSRRDTAISRLWRRFESDLNSGLVVPSLDMLIRALDARTMTVVEERRTNRSGQETLPSSITASVGSRSGAIAPNTTTGDDDEPASQSSSGPLLPSEAALLSNITDKFYSSWAFKGLAMAIVASFGLAAAGTIILGSQSYRIGDEMEKKYTETSAALDGIQKKAQDSLLVQDQRIQATATHVATQEHDFDERTKQALVDMSAIQQNFKKASIDTIISNLKDDLKTQTGALSDEITGKKKELDGMLVTLTTDVNSAASQTSEIKAKAKDATTTLEEVMPKLKIMPGQIDSALDTIKHFQDAQTAIQKAQKTSEDSASAAQKAQSEVVQQLSGIQNDIAARRGKLKEIDAALSPLEQDLLSAANSARDLRGDMEKIKSAIASLRPISDKLPAIEQLVAQVGDLDRRLSLVEHKPPAEPSRPLIQENLTGSQKCAVQRELNKRTGQNLVVDGIFGESTKAAIMQWQRGIGAAQNGQLEQSQITNLIGTGEVPSCPQSANVKPKRNPPSR
jgi:hypothetical protein